MGPKENGTKTEQRNILNDSSSPIEKDIKFPFDNKANQFEKKMTKKEEKVKELTQEISFTNMIATSTENDKSAIPTSNLSLLENSLPTKEPSNVWSSLRKIKESETDYATIFNSKTDKATEIVSMGDIDDMIKDLALQIADKRTVKKPVSEDIMIKADLTSITEDNDENEEAEKDTVLRENTVIINNTGIQKNIKPFNFEVWKSEMDAMFEQPGDPLEKKASDELYLKNLRQKIQVSVEKLNKENKNKDKAKDRRVEKTDVNKSPPPKRVDDFAILKLKEKERKKKKQEVKFQQKVVDNEDKMKEMSIKSKKIEKISLESQEEIQKIREMAKKLVAKSEAKENEFNEIFLNLDNLENISTESDKKKGRKGKKKTEKVQTSILSNEVHWTEEENNKWASDKKEVSKVTNVLAALRAAAENGQSKLVAESLKETISNCKKLEQESEEEKIREKTRQIEVEKQRKEEEIKAQKNKENEAKKKLEIEKEEKQKEDEEAEHKKQIKKKMTKEGRSGVEAVTKKEKLEKEKEEELKCKKKSIDLQNTWKEKERQRIEKEETLKRVKEEERLQRQEEYLENMKKEEERKKKEMHAKLEEERRKLEEEKAKELQMLEIRRAREEECRKEDKERKKRELKTLQEERQHIEKLLENQKIT